MRDYRLLEKVETSVSDLERRVSELETRVRKVEGISDDHESVLDRQAKEISFLELQISGQASRTSPSKDSDTKAKQAPTPAGANDTALDESATQAPTSTVPNEIVVDESATLAPNPQGQCEDSSDDSKHPSRVAKAPPATSPSSRLHDSDEDSETKAKKQISTSAEVVEVEDSDMDQKPAAKLDAEKVEKEVGAEKEGAGRKKKWKSWQIASSSSSTEIL